MANWELAITIAWIAIGIFLFLIGRLLDQIHKPVKIFFYNMSLVMFFSLFGVVRQVAVQNSAPTKLIELIDVASNVGLYAMLLFIGYTMLMFFWEIMAGMIYAAKRPKKVQENKLIKLE